jgi:hypothetical protein
MSDVQPCHDFTLTSAMLRTPLVNTPDSTRIATTQAIAGRTIAGASGLVAGCHGPRNRRVRRCRRNHCCRRTNASLQVQRIVLSQAPAVPLAPAAPAVTSTVPGISSFYTSNANFYRIDTAVEVPQVSAASGQLRIHGMVDHEVRLSFDDVLARTLVGEDITLTCVSNTVGGSLTGTARWLGVRLKDLRRSGREPRCEPTGRPIDQRVDVGIPDRGAGRQTPGTARDRHER